MLPRTSSVRLSLPDDSPSGDFDDPNDYPRRRPEPAAFADWIDPDDDPTDFDEGFVDLLGWINDAPENTRSNRPGIGWHRDCAAV